ncbi:MAG: isoleucine--tRNA ligase [Candidatus Nanohaloarchaea archaeon]
MTDYNPQEIENEISDYWKENNVKEKVRDSTEGNEPFFLIDGPPYLNGAPHVGHMQGKVIKDVMLRFKQMQGYDVHDQAGFDTHGLPNELATEEELGIEDKNEIGDSISAAKFIEECKDRATSAKGLWQGVMNDLAVWQDFEDPYMTYDADYIETAWWLLKKTHEQDLLYEDGKPIHWCPRCQTSLSGYEVTDEYQQIEDIAVFVKFPLRNRDEKVVIWTTTPWTIPSNMAVFVHPEFEYATVEVDGEKLIIAEQLVERAMSKAGYEENDYEITEIRNGEELEGLAYDTPFLDEIPRQQELDEQGGVHKVHTSEELVTLEEGTGLVHAATGHGPEDYEETRPMNLPVFSPLDEEGNYTAEAGELEGENVLEVDPEIESRLEQKGLLFHSEPYQHEYPHCWRCKTELIYRAADQWFIENEEVKQRMLEENEGVDWVPENAQQRFHNFVEDSPDWCISRQNYWGIPIPIWRNDETGEIVVIGSFEELEEKVGELPEDFDPHKHVVDELTWEGENGGTFRRIPDIFDVWFDSGIAPFASLHYPFEEQPFEDMWPMDFITEASDQIRGWFYSLMFTGILGFDEAPYEKILFQGYVLDAEGEKMSKSLGNVVDPQDQVDEYGADLPRFYQLRLAPPWEQKNYDETEIENEIYRLFSVLWNTKEFYRTYEEDVERPEELEVEDKWILSKINSIEEEAEEKMEDAHFFKVARELEGFIVNDLSRWYVKKVRSRLKDGDEAVIWTLREVLEQVNFLIAPFAPYITEKIYREFDGEEISIHAEDYPQPTEEFLDEGLEKGMEVAREIVEESVKLRDQEEYNLRWPARRMVLSVEEETQEMLEEFEPLIKDMANVKEIEYGGVASNLSAKPDYSKLGPKFGGNADEVADEIEKLEHSQIEELQELGELELEKFQIEEEDLEIVRESPEDVGSKAFSKGELYLDLEMTEEIEREALASEIVRAVQQKRKEVGLEVEDEVDLSVEEDLEKFSEMFHDRINLSSLNFEGEKLEYEASAEFKDQEIRFSFSNPV